MSFILDALRKVDREARHSEEVVPPVAAIEKLRKEKQSRRRQFAAMAAIGVASAVATTLLLRRPPVPEPVPAPQPSAAETPVDVPLVEGALPEPPQDAPVREPDPPAESPGLAPTPTAAVEISEPPTSEPAPELPQLVLQGTSVLAGKPVAVVSDRRVFEGDTIEGAVVIRIEERLVELEFEGRRFTLTL